MMTRGELVAAALDLHSQMVRRYGPNPEIIEDMQIYVQRDRVVAWLSGEACGFDEMCVAVFRKPHASPAFRAGR